MKSISALLLAIILTIPVFSQKYLHIKTWDVDSLLQVLPGQVDEERVKTLNCLATSLFFIDSDSSKQFADEAMILAEKMEYREGIAAAYRNLGNIYAMQGLYSEALRNVLEALSLSEKMKDKYMEGMILFDIAWIHYYVGNFDKTVEYIFKSIHKLRGTSKNAETFKKVRDTLLSYQSLALVYRLMENPEKALEYNLMVDEVMKNKDNGFRNTEIILNLWTTGIDYITSEKYDSARSCFFRALAYPDENRNIQALKYRAVIALGSVSFQERNIDSAEYYWQSAFEWYVNNGILYWAMDVGFLLGYLNFEKGDLERAELYFLQAEKLFNEAIEKKSWFSHDSLEYLVTFGNELYFPLPVAQKMRMVWIDGLNTYYYLYKINEIKNKPAEALKYHIYYTDAIDTFYTLRKNSEIIELQTRYESEKYEEQIASLSRENEFKEFKLTQSRLFLFGLLGLVVLIIFLAIIIIRMNKVKDREKSLLLQQKLFRSQMNPHFLFNSLVSIQNFIVNEEPVKAGKYLSKFSRLVRNILDSSFEEYVPVEEEISIIENYLELQKVRFSDQFDYSIEVDKSIDTESARIPPMMAQPIIENAIEHGVKHKGSQGHIFVRFRQMNGSILFEVEDDGIGRKKAMEIMLALDKDHKSIATAITHERIRLLNKRLKKKISMRVEDLVGEHNEPTGTRVVFEIPVVF